MIIPHDIEYDIFWKVTSSVCSVDEYGAFIKSKGGAVVPIHNEYGYELHFPCENAGMMFLLEVG